MFKDLRVRIFNWLAAGRLTLSYEEPKQYTFAGIGLPYNSATGQLNYNINPQPQVPEMNLAKSNINFNVAKANGGWIVQVNPAQSNTLNIGGLSNTAAELYLISDDEEFDSALGRIVTTACLKA
jgi:hypothetical protein